MAHGGLPVGKVVQKTYICDWSVNKKTFDEFCSFIVDLGFDVSINDFNLVATNGKKTLKMFKGFKCDRNMLATSRRFREFKK